MKYCDDCTCFSADVGCRAYGNPADASDTACIMPGGRIGKDYHIHPTKGKCANCKDSCDKRIRV